MYFFSIVNAMKKESEINFHSVFVIILHLSVVLGLIHEWGFFLGIEIWTLWFIIHLIVWSIYVIYIETLIEVNETIKTHMLYHSLFISLWFYQRIYVLNYQSLQNYEVGCKRDLLVVTSSTTLTILLVSFSAAFTLLIS